MGLTEDGAAIGAQSLNNGANQLPFELLEEIFRYCYHDQSVCYVPSEAPFNILRVCSMWYAVVTDIPSLWSSLDIHIKNNYCTPSLPTIRKWIERSGNSTLSLSLKVAIDDGGTTEEQAAGDYDPYDALNFVVSHVSRWENLYLDLSKLSSHSMLPQIRDNEATSLKQLSIRLLNITRPPFTQPPRHLLWLNTLTSSSPLASISSFGGAQFAHQNVLKLPYIFLTSVLLESCGQHQFLDILRSSPDLKDCQVHLKNITRPPIPTPFYHPTLQTLSVIASLDIWAFFDTVTLPSLNTLELTESFESRYGHSDEDEFTQFLTRSACPISTLILRRVKISTGGLFRCLQKLSGSLIILKLFSPSLGKNRYSCLGNRSVWHMTEKQNRYKPKEPKQVENDTPLAPLATSGPAKAGVGGVDWSFAEEDDGQPGLLCPYLEQLTLDCAVGSADGMFFRMIESRYQNSEKSIEVNAKGIQDSSPPIPLSVLRNVSVDFPDSSHDEDIEKLNQLFSKGLEGYARVNRMVQVKEMRKNWGAVGGLPKDYSKAALPLIPYSNWTRR